VSSELGGSVNRRVGGVIERQEAESRGGDACNLDVGRF